MRHTNSSKINKFQASPQSNALYKIEDRVPNLPFLNKEYQQRHLKPALIALSSRTTVLKHNKATSINSLSRNSFAKMVEREGDPASAGSRQGKAVYSAAETIVSSKKTVLNQKQASS
jgi:hypothetical protein